MTRSLRQYDMVTESNTQIKQPVRSGIYHGIMHALQGRSGSPNTSSKVQKRIPVLLLTAGDLISNALEHAVPGFSVVLSPIECKRSIIDVYPAVL